MDDQGDSSSIKSRGSIHSAASAEHKGLPMPRLQSFSPGQVFNSSSGMQVLVIPSKDDHILEVNVTWQLSVHVCTYMHMRLVYECTLRDHNLIVLHWDILTRPMAPQPLLAMEASDNCINLNVQWNLCQLVYIATLGCLCKMNFGFFSSITSCW